MHAPEGATKVIHLYIYYSANARHHDVYQWGSGLAGQFEFILVPEDGWGTDTNTPRREPRNSKRGAKDSPIILPPIPSVPKDDAAAKRKPRRANVNACAQNVHLMDERSYNPSCAQNLHLMV